MRSSVYRTNRVHRSRIAVHIEAQYGFCRRQLCIKTGKAIRTANIDRKTARTGRRHRQCAVSYIDFVPADRIDILAVGNILECCTAGKRNQCQTVNTRVRIRVTADKRHIISADVVSVRGVLTLPECRNLLAQLVEHPDMLRKLGIQRIRNRAVRFVLTEVGGSDCAFQMIAVVCASGIRQRSVRSDVDLLSLCKFDFRTVIDTGNAAEGEHQV